MHRSMLRAATRRHALLVSIALAAPCSAHALADGGNPEPEPLAVSTAQAPATPWWTAGFQSTYVIQRKPSMRSEYQGENSLIPQAETGYTLTATIYAGARPWSGGEFFLNPETIQSEELSHLHGLGGFTNGENQKTGGPFPTPYIARAFFRQTVHLGGDPVELEAGPNQFATRTTSRRLVFTVGRLSVIDIFDNNAYSHDPRAQFLNWALMTYGASDFAADARGYTVGGALEWYQDAWAVRVGRFAQPAQSNGLYLDSNIFRVFGDNLEIEHAHVLGGLPGKIRFAGFRNVAVMGAFRDALAAANGGVPSVADVRHLQAKVGFGAAFEQALSRDLAAFGRYSWNDGRTETYAYTEIERSLTMGLCARGRWWGRADDSLGVAYALNGLSSAHQAYLAAGGLGAFIGDGRLTYGPEQIGEAYYSWNAARGLWVTADIQRAVNPAYNRDRGPASFLGGRVHAEW